MVRVIIDITDKGNKATLFRLYKEDGDNATSQENDVADKILKSVKNIVIYCREGNDETN